jgi:hypothetical protein
MCAFVYVTIVWPIWCLLFVENLAYPWRLTLASLPGSFGSLLLNMRVDHVSAETVWWALLWNAVFIALSVVVVVLAINTLDRRLGATPATRRLVESVHTAETPLSAG